MNISSSSLFRYTTKFEYLKQIIEHGFTFRPCVEEMAIGGYPNDPFSGTNVVIDELHSLAVCFCDLPLGQSKSHRDQYGDYAIAMSKDWAMRQRITPIRYYHAHSPDHEGSTTRLLLDLLASAQRHQLGPIDQIMELQHHKNEAPLKSEMDQLPDSVKKLLAAMNELLLASLDHFWRTFKFTRIYEGEWSDRVTDKTTNRTFYDEREWRAVTDDPNSCLTFAFADIRHIFVKTKAEREELAELINTQSERLQISDKRDVWSLIKLNDDFLPDI